MYQVFTVFKKNGLLQEYMVINMQTKQIQSVWTTRIDAMHTCTTLNNHANNLKEVKS